MIASKTSDGHICGGSLQSLVVRFCTRPSCKQESFENLRFRDVTLKGREFVRLDVITPLHRVHTYLWQSDYFTKNGPLGAFHSVPLSN